MDILAAAAPVQPMPQYQNVTVQPSAPPPKGRATMQLVWTTINLAIAVFFVVMFYRFVRATEKIADKMDKGIVVRKEDATA